MLKEFTTKLRERSCGENEYIKKVDGNIVSIKQDIDVNKLGEQEVILEVKKDNVTKETIKVKEAEIDDYLAMNVGE